MPSNPSRLLTLALVLLVSIAAAAPARGWDRHDGPVLDSVDLQRAGRELYAMRDLAPTAPLRLERNEEVIWMGAQGYVGVALTTKRVLGVTRSHGWRDYRMRREDGQAIAQLGGRLALVVTARRVLWLDSRSGSLQVERLGAGEHLVTSHARDNVAVAVTNRRGMGFSGGRSFSADTPIRAQERCTLVPFGPIS